MGGRPPETSDVDILELFISSGDPVLFTTEVAEQIDITQQGAFHRLQQLEEKGYLDTKSTSNARIWWITHAGRDYVMSQRD